jgi:hypothetical protein
MATDCDSAVIRIIALSQQITSQVVAPGPSSDRHDGLECTIAGNASVLRSRPALTGVTVEYRVVDVCFENRIDVKLY